MTSARCILAALVIASAAPLLLPATARAEPTAEDLASARQLFKEGRALREKGDLPKALQKLRAAHALGQTPITGLELARTYVLVGRLVDAREVSLGVSRIPIASDETGRSDAARSEAAKLAKALEPRLASLVISVKGLPAASVAEVSVDGEAIPPAALGEPRSADPGAHVVVLKVGGNVPSSARADVTVKEGESREVVLDATPPPLSALAEVPHPPPPHGHSNLLLVTGTTVAGFGVLFGASFGIATLGTKGSLTTDCPGGRCGPAHHDELNAAQTEATASTVSFVVAGVGAAVAIVDLLTRPKGEATKRDAKPEARLAPEVGPGWLGLHGSF